MRGIKKLFKLLIILIFMLIIGFSYMGIKYPIGYKDIIIKRSNVYDLDPYLVASIINVESSYDPNAISPKGAKGLMQISSQTGSWASEVLEIEDYVEENLFHPETNIRIGTWYLNRLFKEFNQDLDLVLMAYNAGSGNVNKWLNNKEYCKDGVNIDDIPFKETKDYIERINKNYKIYKLIYGRYFEKTNEDNSYINLISNVRRLVKYMIQ